MPKPKDLSVNEKEFVQRLLHEAGTRYDGREFDEFRQVDLQFGTSLGHVEVTLGGTRLVVVISAEVTKPLDDRPFEGQFLITTDISAMASPLFDNYRQSDDENILARLVEKAIRRSNALDLENLCIVAGKSCWLVRADVHYLDFDGGLIDATSLGVIAGLLHFKRPDTSIEGKKTIIHSLEERAPVPLSVLHIPISVTFSFFKPLPPAKNASGAANGDNNNNDNDENDDDNENGNGADTEMVDSPSSTEDDVVLVDATAREEALRHGEMTITINKNREICQISKAGGHSVEAYVLMNCANKAFEIASNLTNLVLKRLKEDSAKRNAENPEFELSAENDR
ncbi:hypothetical protein D0Z00_000414 [Geotrichum galactomycetum]|uniref:Uncharacterized protein n=1 Tax=Geotrichum galactomycetum TaxID=27317 RepID=A0ACB6VA60_9ASCO|nr:hypothetical protein D0Z00_000414 [Geotrichum candidum]